MSNPDISLDKHLASLLGWKNVFDRTFNGKQISVGDFQGWTQVEVPRWTEDDGAAFRLMVEHDLDVRVYERICYVKQSSHPYVVAETYTDPESKPTQSGGTSFSEKAAAVRVAVVRAVIAKLEGNL